MSRILVVAPDLPHPPFTGAHTRPLSLIRALARRHEVVVVGAAAPGAELAPLEELCLAVGRLRAEPYRRGPARSVLAAARRSITPVPLIGRSIWTPLSRLVDDALAKFRPAAIQLETMYAVHYRRDGLPAVIDLPDVVSGLCAAAAEAHPLRYAAARTQSRTAARSERAELAAFRAILTINDADADRLRALGLAPVTVPLAIAAPDAADLAPHPTQIRTAARSVCAEPAAAGGPALLRVLFVGSFAHAPNRAAARFILDELVPALAAAGTRCQLTMAGRDAGPWSAERRRRGSAVGGIGSTAVHVVSDPPDIAPLYRRSDAVVVPLGFGGGTKNKTLEAMAWARPVVGSPQAFTGLPDDLAGQAFVRVPLNAGRMAGALARLAADAALRECIGAAGRAWVLEHHTQESVDAVVDAVYERVLAGAGSPA